MVPRYGTQSDFCIYLRQFEISMVSCPEGTYFVYFPLGFANESNFYGDLPIPDTTPTRLRRRLRNPGL